MKKLIFFSRDMAIGGLEKSLLNLLNSLSPLDYDITLILESASGELLPLLDKRVHVKEYSLSLLRFSPLRRAVNLIKRLFWRLFNGNKYDFSCAYCTYSVIGSRLALYASENSSLFIHSNYFSPLRDEADSLILKELGMEHFSHLIFVSNESLADFLPRYPQLEGKCRVINNLVNCEEIKSLSLESVDAPPLSRPVFAFIGRLEEESKRISRLIGAFAAVHEKKPESSLLIVGGGKDRGLCEALIESRGLKDCVFMAGPSVNPYPYMRLCDCVVLSSDYEGFPVVYYEALTLGKRIVTTVPTSDDALSIADYADIAEKDVESLAGAMLASLSALAPEADIEGLNKSHLNSFLSLLH